MSATGKEDLYFEKEKKFQPLSKRDRVSREHVEFPRLARFGKGKLEEPVFQRQHHTEQVSAS